MEKYCIDCGKQISKKAKRCKPCNTLFKIHTNKYKKFRLDVWDDELKIINLYSFGKSKEDIGKIYHCDEGVIHKILLKNNIKIRPAKYYMYNHKFNVGKKHSDHTKELIKLAHLNRIVSDSTRLKISETKQRLIKEGKFKTPKMAFKKGNIPWNKGLTKSNNKIIFKIAELRRGKTRSKETIQKIKKARARQITPLKDTKIEVKVQNFLKQLGIEYFTHQYIKEIEHGYQCDILIPSMNLVIECDGDYWHKYPIGREIDHIRTSELLEKGFKVLRLWEFEIKAMNINEFKEKLK